MPSAWTPSAARTSAAARPPVRSGPAHTTSSFRPATSPITTPISAAPTSNAEGRFLGGFQAEDGDCDYRYASRGDATWFQGREWISRAGKTVYELYYHGGLIRD
jgi:Domain of unknown function (DUF5680)